MSGYRSIDVDTGRQAVHITDTEPAGASRELPSPRYGDGRGTMRPDRAFSR